MCKTRWNKQHLQEIFSQNLQQTKSGIEKQLTLESFSFDCGMNTSCTKSCDWISDLPPRAVFAYTPRNILSCSQTQYHQQPRIMETSFCPTKETSTETFSGNRFCSPTEDIGLLNIPSIYETMNNSSFDDVHSGEKPLEWKWPSDHGETLCAGIEAEKCETSDVADDEVDRTTNTSEEIPREPLKRLRRQRANDRERRRMKSLNGALNNLKRCIPLPKTKRRVTKLEILRIACNYIQTLWETLNGGSEGHTEPLVARGGNQHPIVNGMSVTQRLSLLSNNLKFNFQL